MSMTIENIQPKSRTIYGKVHQGEETTNTYNAELVPRKRIRIYGTYRNHINGPQEFDRVFKMGDWAEYDSYNLKYTGKIVGIGKKTVTILSYPEGNSGKRHQLDLHTFCYRNWDYNAEKIAKDNAETSMYI